MLKFIKVLAMVVLVATSAVGQVVLQSQAEALSAPAKFGWSVSGIGDLNHDGTNDYIVGSPYATIGGQRFAGKAVVYSGAGGGILFEPSGLSISECVGYGVGGGDGLFLVSTQTKTRVYNDAGNLVWTKAGIGPCGSLGDVNGDGSTDFYTSQRVLVSYFYGTIKLYQYQYFVVVYSGAGAAPELYRKSGIVAAGLGDLNADGKDEFIIGDKYAQPTGQGTAIVYNGVNGLPLYSKAGSAQRDAFGCSVANARDCNGDGVNDFVVGSTGFKTSSGAGYLYSGASGALLCQVIGPLYTQWGFSVSAAGNGHFAVGSLMNGSALTPGAVHIFDASGTFLQVLSGVVDGDNFGTSVDFIDPEIIVGAPNAGAIRAGIAYLYR